MHRIVKQVGTGVLLCAVLFMTVPSRAQMAEGKDKFLGNIIAGTVPRNFVTYWNQVTPENAGKWGSVESSRNNMQWANLDRAYEFAKKWDYPFKQHNFIWGQQQPGWIASLPEDEQREEVEEWIRLYGERYPDTDMIDVVNEPIHAPPPYKEALGGDGETGWDWIIWAFEKARQYCPGAQLILNEYNVIHSNANINKMIEIANLLQERDLIDAIGVQGHYFELRYYAPTTLKNGLNRLAATGLPVYISEFDINEEDDDAQLLAYQKYFPLLWEHPGVKGITLWGYQQGAIWQTDAYLIRSDGTERPAMEWLWDYMTDSSVGKEAETSPSRFILYDNYPNPFNPATEIPYSLDEPGHVRLSIFDMLGREIRSYDSGMQHAGLHTFRWDTRDDAGNEMPGGHYVYQITVTTGRGIETDSRKMTLVR